MADGTSFQIDIGVQADGVAPAAAQLAQLADRLTAAQATASAAADAVRSGEASYRATETAADKAAKALEKINVAMESASGTKLANLQVRQAEAAKAADAAKESLVAEAAALDKLKAASSAAAAEESKLKKTQDEAKKAAQAAEEVAEKAAGTGSSKAIASGLGKLGGPLGEVGKKLFGAKAAVEKLGKALGDGGPYAIAAVAAVAVVAAVAAISAAAIVGVAKITEWAVSLADAARSNSLLSQGIAKSVAGGIELDKTIGKLEDSVPATRDELTQMASELAKTGLKGDELSKALETAAIKAAKAKFGPDWQKQLISLDSSTARLKRGFSSLFSGLKIEGLLEALSSLVNLFSKNDAAGRAIKVVFESLFQPLVDGLTAWIPKARAAFLQFEILVLKALIAIKPFGSKILLVAEAIGVLAALIIGGLVFVVGVLVVNLAVLAVGFALIVGAVVAVGYGIFKLGQFFADLSLTIGTALVAAWNFVVDTFNGIVDFLSGLSLTQIGTDMINGLVTGITNAGAAVLKAVTGVVGGAIDAAKKTLGIASPSKVFAEIGMNTGEGMAGGVDKSADKVQSSLESLASPQTALEATGGAAKPGAPASNDQGGGKGVQAVFNFYGVAGAEDAQDLFTKALEGFAVQIGAEVPG